ncbi:hypothetical protein DIC66_05200 [Rhodoferax lacus]|uniref:Uncharacterized protein n=1 Tax=Rhodoferax lacus TaxID=2184758 RepID=A0A3E1RFH8_9BURK|nr:hypothetical protein [Rhodoferax lacus]RFO98118.1 hypothetical protein DIC66_05200 [Rhodoferax lacus]
MTKPTSRTLALCILLGATLQLPTWAAGNITLRQGASETIELTNLDEPDAGQAVVAEGPANTAAAATLAMPVPRQSVQASRSTLRGKRLADKDPAKDAQDTDTVAEEGPQEADTASSSSAMDSYQASDAESRSAASESKSLATSSAQPSAGGSYGATYTPGAPGASGTDGGTGTTGTTASGSTGTGTSAGATTPAAPLTGIQAILSQYRNLMVQEASAANYMNTNPAISRRYLAVDRTTYQARLGQ